MIGVNRVRYTVNFKRRMHFFEFVFDIKAECAILVKFSDEGSDEIIIIHGKKKGLLCTFMAVVSVMLDKLFPVIGGAVFAIILGMVLNQFWKIPK